MLNWLRKTKDCENSITSKGLAWALTSLGSMGCDW